MTEPGSITITQAESRSFLSPAAVGRGGPSVTLVVTEAPRRPASSFGGWSVVRRRQATGAIEWEGLDPDRVTFAGIVDGWRENRPVEADIARLEAMARPLGSEPPPAVTAAGALPPGPRLWVIESLEPGSALWNSDGRRVRQAYTVTLLQRVRDELIRERASDRARRRTGAQQVRLHRVKSGETMLKIAARQLGSSSRWREIASLNKGTNDPRKPLKAGQRLKLPMS